jgi:hypothetical protein
MSDANGQTEDLGGTPSLLSGQDPDGGGETPSLLSGQDPDGGGETPSPLSGNGTDGQGQDGGAAPSAQGTYEPLSVPEGVELDDGTKNEINALGAELGLTQEQLQRVFDFGVSKGVFGGQELDEILLKRREEARALDTRRVMSDPELKGYVGDAQRALVRFDPGGGVMRTLRFYGVDNSPEMVRFFGNIGRAFRESGFVTTPGRRQAPAPAAETLQGMASAIYPPSVMK